MAEYYKNIAHTVQINVDKIEHLCYIVDMKKKARMNEYDE